MAVIDGLDYGAMGPVFRLKARKWVRLLYGLCSLSDLQSYNPISRLDGALSDKVDSLERDWFKLKYELMLVVCSMPPTEYPANLPATVRL